MKRDDVLVVFPDATNEQINALLNIRGKEVNEANATINDLRSQIAERDRQIDEANKAKSAQMTREEELAQLIEEAKQQKRENAMAANRIKVESILTGIGLAVDDVATQIDLMVSEDAEATVSRAQSFADFITAQRDATKAATEKSMLAKMGHPQGSGGKGETTKDEFAKMTYSQKLEIKQNNPELFKKLSSKED